MEVQSFFRSVLGIVETDAFLLLYNKSRKPAQTHLVGIPEEFFMILNAWVVFDIPGEIMGHL